MGLIITPVTEAVAADARRRLDTPVDWVRKPGRVRLRNARAGRLRASGKTGAERLPADLDARRLKKGQVASAAARRLRAPGGRSRGAAHSGVGGPSSGCRGLAYESLASAALGLHVRRISAKPGSGSGRGGAVR
jgi:hypothetical protein